MSTTPRRALPDDAHGDGPSGSPRRRLWIIALAALLVLGLTFATAHLVGHRHNTNDEKASPSPSSNDASSASTSASSSSASACASSSQLAVSPVWASALNSAAQAYTPKNSDGCSPISIQASADSDVVSQGLGQAKGWVPEDPSVAAMAPKIAGTSPTVVGTSPLVLVAQPQVKDALKGRSLDGQVLYQLASSQADWKAVAGKDWGPLRLVLPDPTKSTTGSIAFGDLAALVAGHGVPTNNPQAIRQNMIDVSQVQFHVVQAVDTPGQVLQNLAPVASDDTGRGAAGPRVGVTTETALLQSKPAANSVAAWPLLGGAAGEQLSIANPGNDQQVADFITWLKGSEGQKALAAAGVTTTGAKPDATALKAVGLPASMPVPVQAATAKNVATARAVYQGLGKRMAITNVLDASGSMGQFVPGTQTRKIDMVTQAAAATWTKWPDGSAVDLLTFNSDAAHRPQIQPVIPWTVVGTRESDAALKQSASRLGTIKAGGGTPLYQAIWQGYSYALQHYDASKNNQVFVITDGADEAAKENINLPQLVARLKAADPSKPIRMRYLAVGPSADSSTLASLAKQTGGTFAQATSVQQLPQVVSAIIAAG